MDKQDYLVHKRERFAQRETLPGFEWFNPWTDPNEAQIPECRVCAADARGAMQKLVRRDNDEYIIMNHTHSCLWYNYFESRILDAYPDAPLMWKAHSAMFKLRKAHEQLMRAQRFKCWWIKGRLVTEIDGHRSVGQESRSF